MKLQWVVNNKKADFKAIASKYGIDQVTARIIRNRDIIEEADIERFINGDMSYMHSPYLLKDMDNAVNLIKKDILEHKKIRIIGDYDVDGVCATFILLKGLKSLGADASTIIPHRIKDGYGLNDSLIEDAHNEGVDTILTCDNGISAVDQVNKAKKYGMKVIITDHHEIPFEEKEGMKNYIIPGADAVVDPKQEDCGYPFKNICGAMVAFKLILALMGERYPDIIKELIPFVAMATVCDVMELLDENRIIVKEGIKEMIAPSNVGLRALVIATGLSDRKISAYHFGFVLGPTINASGRLDAASRALELFNCDDFNEACLIATSLRQLNDERKALTEDGTQKAIDIIENGEIREDRVLVVYLSDCHESIAGIIAGRIKEKYYKPSIVFTDAEDGIKGSGRSIEAYDMYEELNKVKTLFTKFGGHKMAAGMSLAKVEDVEILRKELNRLCSLKEEDFVHKLKIDFHMPLSYVSMPLIRDFAILEPCGTANPKPLFADKGISLLSYNKKGRSRVIGKFKIMDEFDRIYDMVFFDDLDAFDKFITDSFGREALNKLERGNMAKNEMVIKIAYVPDINVYNNIESMQIVMKYYSL